VQRSWQDLRKSTLRYSCLIGTTAGDDVAPYADRGGPITCKELIEAAKLFEIGTYWCSSYEAHELHCCLHMDLPEDSCTLFPNGITAGDDSLPYEACSKGIAAFVECESESDVCTIQGKFTSLIAALLQPAENPCMICLDEVTDGDDHVSPSWVVNKEIIESYTTFEAGSELCAFKGNEEAYCFPTSTALENPCSIFPGSATAGRDFVPISSTSTCGVLIEEARVFENGSRLCKKIGLRDFLLPRFVWRFPLARQLKQKEEYLDVTMTMRFLLERSVTRKIRCLVLLPEMIYLCCVPAHEEYQ